MNASGPESVAAQKLLLAQETALRPLPLLSTCCPADHDPPENVYALPAESTATQKLLVGHETDAKPLLASIGWAADHPLACAGEDEICGGAEEACAFADGLRCTRRKPAAHPLIHSVPSAVYGSEGDFRSTPKSSWSRPPAYCPSWLWHHTCPVPGTRASLAAKPAALAYAAGYAWPLLYQLVLPLPLATLTMSATRTTSAAMPSPMNRALVVVIAIRLPTPAQLALCHDAT